MKTTKKLSIVLGLFLMLVVCWVARAEDKPAPEKEKPKEDVKPVVVPFELLPSGHMTVMVKVNDKGPYKLIFDTGAPITLVNNKVAKESGLIKEKKLGLFGSQGAVTIKNLKVGDREAENVTAMVIDHPTVEAISKAFGQIDGIVGFPFFARYKVTLDYQAKTLTFVPNGFEPPDVMRDMTMTILSMSSGKAKAPVMLAPAAQWGLLTTKGEKDEEAGVDIKTVLAGSAADVAGLKAGDRLLTLDGRWTDTVADVYTAAGYVKAGTTVPVKIQRNGKELVLKVKPTAGI
jgi:hypothetical protein